jgi:hypothetical protein
MKHTYVTRNENTVHEQNVKRWDTECAQHVRLDHQKRDIKTTDQL